MNLCRQLETKRLVGDHKIFSKYQEVVKILIGIHIFHKKVISRKSLWTRINFTKRTVYNRYMNIFSLAEDCN